MLSPKFIAPKLTVTKLKRIKGLICSRVVLGRGFDARLNPEMLYIDAARKVYSDIKLDSAPAAVFMKKCDGPVKGPTTATTEYGPKAVRNRNGFRDATPLKDMPTSAST